MDHLQTTRFVSRFEPLLHIPAFTQKDFRYVHTGPPTKGNSTEEFVIIKIGVHNSSLKHNHLYMRGKVQSKNNNHLYAREIKTQSQTLPQSSLHKRDKAQSQTTISITSTQEG